jgi:hypothetical protein
MPLRHQDLPSDPDQLAELALALAAENERLRAALRSINTLHFGTRSERLVVLVDEQMTLGLGDLATDTSPPPSANDDVGPKPKASPRPSRKPTRRNISALPKHLPRCEQVIEPDSTICPCCTGQMHRPDAPHRRVRARGARRGASNPPRAAHGASEIRLPQLRECGGAGAGPVAADRGRHGIHRPGLLGGGLQVRLAHAAEPPDPDARRLRRQPRSLHVGALG